MSEFTPGPWDVDRIVDIWDVGNRANAHLISAAPEMYDALKAFTDCWSDEIGSSNPSYEEVANAKAALLKAEGKS